ncbi:MAG: MFS transporter [Actinobacteria bacterium]|nr:MFS transporter [Actinomycetota bacterium]
MNPPPRGTVAIAYALSATGILANSIILPVLPDIADDLHVSSGRIGLIVAAASLPGVIAAPLIGLLADRFGRRRVIVPCLVVFGLGGLAAGLARSFGVMLGLRLVQGVGAAGLVNLAIVVLGDHFDGAERARKIGRNALALTLGLSIFPTLGGAIAEQWGWRASFVPYGAALVVAVVTLIVLPDIRPEEEMSFARQLRGAGSYLRDRRVYAMSAAGAAVFVLVFGVATTLPIHLDEEFHAGALVPAIRLRDGIGRPLRNGWPGRRSPPRGVAGPIVPLQDYAAALAPPEHRGIVVAVWVAAARAGQAIGPAVAGAAIATIGTGGAFVAGTVFASVLCVAAGVVRPGLKLQGVR